MNSRNRLAGALALWVSLTACRFRGGSTDSKLNDEMRQPWERGDISTSTMPISASRPVVTMTVQSG